MKKGLRSSLICLILLASLLISAFPVSAAAAWTKNSDGFYYNSEGEIIPDVTARGMDVSTFQGKIDWAKIYDLYQRGELDFVILRCGYGSDYEDQDDETFAPNADACEKYGIPYGVYLFSYALNVDMAHSEAKHTIRLLEGRNLSYPVYYDLEGSNTVGERDAAFYKAISKAYCDDLQALGYEVGIYSSRSWFTGKLSTIEYDKNGYQKWVAEFNPHLKYDGGFDIWQCTSSGSVSGVGGRVDLSFSFMDKRTANHTYVTFDLNTSKKVTCDTTPLHAEEGSPYGYLPSPTSSVLRFEGWYTEKEGGKRVTESDVVTASCKQILYAHWSELNYRIEITSGEGITVTDGVQEVKPGSPMKAVTLTPADGFLLPDSHSLPAGLNYHKNADGTYTVSGTPRDDSFTVIPSAKAGSLPAPDTAGIEALPASAGKDDGVLTGLTEGMEYSADGKTWKTVSKSEAENGVSGLKAGTYEIRLKGGEAASVSLLSRAEAPKESDFALIRPMIDTAPLSLNGLSPDYEYRLNGGGWTVGTIGRLRVLKNWTNLEIRVRAKDGKAESEPLSIVVCRFDPDNALNLDTLSVTGLDANAKYYIDGKQVTANKNGEVPFGKDWYGKTVVLSTAKEDGVTFEIAIPAKADPPTGLKAFGETVKGKFDGRVTGIAVGMEYTVNHKNWEPVTAGMVEKGLTDLPPRTVYFRTRAKNGVLASDEVALPIEQGRPLTVTYRAEGQEDVVFELEYERTLKEIPVLPDNPNAVMENSHWDTDLSGVEIVEDVVVTAVYEPTEAYLKQLFREKNGTMILVLSSVGGALILAGIVTAVILGIRKKKAKKASVATAEAVTAEAVTTASDTAVTESSAQPEPVPVPDSAPASSEAEKAEEESKV